MPSTKIIIKPTYTIGFWDMSEDSETLLKIYIPDDDELNIINSFKSEFRKKEWLCSRILINKICGRKIKIKYLDNGRPILEERGLHVSISHSSHMLAIILSRKPNPGIDIEKISDRVLKIKHKFASEKELSLANDEPVLKLLLLWCIKETIVKITGNKSLDFKSEIYAELKDYSKNDTTSVKLYNGDNKNSFEISHSENNGFITAWYEGHN